MAGTVQCEQLRKTYGTGPDAEEGLKGVSLAMHPGQTSVLLGPSGSGKTTLLSILGCIAGATSGQLRVAGKDVHALRQSQLAQVRRQHIGFVFQHSRLLPFLSIHDNIAIVAANAGHPAGRIRQRVAELMDRLDIARLDKRKPHEVSGGQRQRAAIARAIVHHPAVILADEPTASLDWHQGEAVVRLLVEQAKLENAALLVVTHDTRLTPMFDRSLFISDGLLRGNDHETNCPVGAEPVAAGGRRLLRVSPERPGSDRASQ